jgi:NAD(P)-dependent dehydrogenase (short-subunit alcohol dehydrogenase family)
LATVETRWAAVPGEPVVVVGAGGAVGHDVARLLLDAGRPTVVVDSLPEALERSRSALGLDADLALVLDATAPRDVAATFERLRRQHGGLSGLVNCQGIAGRGLVDDVTPDRWDLVMRTNLSSVFYCCQAAIPLMRGVPGAGIVNLASVAGLREQPGSLAYAVSKAGVVMLTRVLADELAGQGIMVHAVCPTAIDSPMVRRAMPDVDMAAYAESQPMGRMLTTDEVARVVVDLLMRPLPHTREAFVI